MPARPVYLDTNVFIEGYEQVGSTGGPAQRLLRAADDRYVTAVASELALAEVLVGPLRRGDQDLADLYRTLFAGSESFRVVPITGAVLERAARIRADHAGLKLPDAIHLATALDSGCTAFVSADQRLPEFESLPLVALTQDGISELLEALS